MVVVEDHALVREGTVQLLAHEPDLDVVGQAGTGNEGLALIERLAPDVAIVDVNLPRMSGVDLAREVATRGLGCRILIVSAYDDDAYVAAALEVGVGGYLLKTASSRELIDALRAVADGILVLDRGVSARLMRRSQPGSRGSKGTGALTPRETDVLGLLARGCSNKEIAAELRLGPRTVEGHVSNLLTKLDASSRTDAVARALRMGLVFPWGRRGTSGRR